MSNPVPAFEYTSCDGCGERLEEGDDLFLHEGEKLCDVCAAEEEIICECGQYKKPQYAKCYECSHEE